MMNIVSTLVILVLTVGLCIVEIPKMLKEKLYRELWTFSILLGFSAVVAILISLDVSIYNPSDFITWIYSPLIGVVKSLLK